MGTHSSRALCGLERNRPPVKTGGLFGCHRRHLPRFLSQTPPVMVKATTRVLEERVPLRRGVLPASTEVLIVWAEAEAAAAMMRSAAISRRFIVPSLLVSKVVRGPSFVAQPARHHAQPRCPRSNYRSRTDELQDRNDQKTIVNSVAKTCSAPVSAYTTTR